MPLHTPDGNVTAPEYVDLDRRLRQGDGINWPGDPRMWLGLGVITDHSDRIIARRLEVWRDNEDGSTSMIGSWHPKEEFRILFDLAGMRVDAPGHVDVLDRIDAANEAKEKELAQQAFESMYETLDHAIHLHVEREEGKHRHFMPLEPVDTAPEAPAEAPVAAPVAAEAS